MQMHRSARWLMPALMLSAIPTFAHAEAFEGVGFAPHMQPAYGQAQTPAEQPSPQTTEKGATPAKKKRFSLGVDRIQIGIGSSTKKTPKPSTKPAKGASATGTTTGSAVPTQSPNQSPGTKQGKYPPATPTTGKVVPGQSQGQYPPGPQAPPPTPPNGYNPYRQVVVTGGLNMNPSVPQVQPDCDEAAVMNGNQVVIPAGADQVTQPVDVDEDQGTLTSLYPGVDTTTDAMFPLPCTEPIGGTLPDEAKATPSPGEEAAQQYIDNFEMTTGMALAQSRAINKPSLMADFTIGPCYISTSGTNSQQVRCDSPQYLLDNEPFEGRDIIYVHGLALDQLTAWLANNAKAHKLWPEDASEFIGPTGYFRLYANEYWHDHIKENLFEPYNSLDAVGGWEWTSHDAAPVYVPKSNRYLVVAWSSNQTMEFAQDAFMVQVRLAMTQGTNVVTPSTYPKQFNKPFCANGCIIISHSTGGEIVSSSMGLASQGHFGPAGVTIMKQMRAHVAQESATSGSRLASIAYALGTASAPPSGAAQVILCGIEDNLFGMTGTCALDTSFVQQSILLDLIPMVAQDVWGPAINASPVPTVTVAGGHTMGNHSGLTSPFLPGLDDGVVSMNSACGNPAKVYPPVSAPSGITVRSLITDFDMGQNAARAVKYFLAQKNLRAPGPPFSGLDYMAGGCTPWLSTMGMVMPVLSTESGTFWDTRQRYHNYFSFIQGSIDHSHDGGGDTANRWPSTMLMLASTPRRYLSSFGAANSEEESAVTDPRIYSRDQDGVYLVNPAFAAQHQFVRGRKLTFRLLGRTHRWWIWRRNYILLDKSQDKSSANFVYEYVERR